MGKGDVNSQFKSGPNHPNWAGGMHVCNGYVKVMAMDGEYKNLHTIMVEWYLGRKLKADECVHHCNENRRDNRLENLELMLKKEHSRLHGKKTFIRSDVQAKSAKARQGSQVKETHSCWKHEVTFVNIKNAIATHGTKKEAAASLGICADTMRARLRHYKQRGLEC